MRDQALLIGCAIALLTGLSPAQSPEEPEDRTLELSQPPSGRPGQELGGSWAVAGGDLFQFQTSIEGGGSFSVNRSFLRGGYEHRFSPELKLGLSLATEVDTYDFKGGGTFAEAAGGTPWTTTREFSIGASFLWQVDSEWTVFGSGSFRSAGEPGAEWSETFTTGGVAAASYTFSRDFTIGAGVLASGRLDGSIQFIPSLLIDWKVTEGLVVTNVRGPRTYPSSAGIELLYQFEEDMTFSVGFRYEYRRFRLDDSGPPPTRGGVGTERSFPVWLRYEWRPRPGIRLHLLGGVSFGERLELQRADGVFLQRQDANPAPFVAIFFGFEF